MAFSLANITTWRPLHLPLFQGRIESVAVNPKQQFLIPTTGWRPQGYTATLTYSYAVGGQDYTAKCDHEFGSEKGVGNSSGTYRVTPSLFLTTRKVHAFG